MEQSARNWKVQLIRFAPGLPALLDYRRDDFGHDLLAGLSVAAVALPVGIAYAQLAGFSPVSGIYASILPLVAYALFGTSRQLVVGPDSATCALIAAALAPLAAGDDALYLSLSLTLTFLTGLFCIGASFLKLGALADFLSKPILVGFLNGVALSIFLGQAGKLFGFTIEAHGILPRLYEFVSKLEKLNWPTLMLSVLSFAVLLLGPRYLRRLPAALLAMVLTGALTALLGLEALGVATVGKVPAGLPALHLPRFPLELLPTLAADAAGLALVSFSSMMLTARSFAEKNGYEIDADREFSALGAANIASALSQGFAISGADSRTAMADYAGGKTQVAGLVAAATFALVLLFFTAPLAYVPIASLGAVLMVGAWSLVDIATLKSLWRFSRVEFALSLLATLGVVAVGAVQAILVVVVLALLRFVQEASRPAVEILGEVPGMAGIHPLSMHDNATTIPGLMLFRFNAPIVFFNAPYFRRQVLAAVGRAGPELNCFVLDMLPVTMIDATGYYVLRDVEAALFARGITLAVAGRQTEIELSAKQRGLDASEALARIRRFSTLRQAIHAYTTEHPAPAAQVASPQ
jgi:high affinity sulfate transporter 1